MAIRPGDTEIGMREGMLPGELKRQLVTQNLVIRIIPGEEWTLSMYRHKTLLVDVYVLVGTIAHLQKRVTFTCGRLTENLLRLLCLERKVQYHHHGTEHKESGITVLGRAHRRLAATLEEDMRLRLQTGDIIFRALPNEHWRLTATSFGQVMWSLPDFHYLAEESTLGTPSVRGYRGSLERVLLQFLCQGATWVEKERGRNAPKVLTFRGKQEDVCQES